jgi:hypothetical protein
VHQRSTSPGRAATVEGAPTLWDSGAVRSPFRARRALALALVVVAVAFGVPRFLTHMPYQRLGVNLDWMRGTHPVVERVIGPPARGVLEKGDIIVGWEGQRFVGRNEMRDAVMHGKGWPKGTFTLEIVRAGQTRFVRVPPVQLGGWQRIRLYTFPMVAVVATPLVALLLVWRRPDLGAAWLFLGFALIQALDTIYALYHARQFEPTGIMRTYLLAYDWLTLWVPAVFLHLMTAFPRPRWTRDGRRASPWYWLVVVAYGVPAVFIAVHPEGREGIETAFTWFQGACILIGVLSLAGRYALPARGDWRPGRTERVLAVVLAATLLLAAVLDALLQGPRAMALVTLPGMRLLITSVQLAWFMSPIVMAFLIANDPLFDPRRLLVRSVPYALLTGVLAGIYLAVVLVAQRLFAAVTGEQAMAFNLVAALVVAFAFAPLRERTQRALDRLYGRDPLALRAALDHAGQALLSALGADEVRAAVEDGLSRGLKRRAALVWAEGAPPCLADGEDLPEDAREAVENLFTQAGVRLENLALQAQRATAERAASELREAAARAELRALHAQVQPHFLFNALNALSYLIETEPPAAQRFTERLADMLRYTVEASERPAALLSEEIGFVEDFLGVARERYENALSFEFAGPPDLLNLAVPPLLLQPLVENSLKHGCSPGTGSLHLRLEAAREAGWLTLRFTDDGDCAGNGLPGLGVGLQNLEQRVLRFGGPGATMSAGRRETGGFCVTVRWPVPPEKEVAA